MQFDVNLDKHHLESLAAKPITALAELIWNALDADANHVDIAFGRNDMNGIEEIRVTDDGHGMTRDELETAFASLGASWKQTATRTRSGQRRLHGKHGRGRFRPASIGQTIRWKSIAEDDGARRLVTAEIRASNLRRVELSDPEPTDQAVGTRVIITGISGSVEGLGDTAPDKLIAYFALYMEKYSPTIVYDRATLDPSTIQRHRATYAIQLAEDVAQLDVIEWTRPIERALCLCNNDGMTLEEIAPGIQAPGFDFTAYLRWEGFAERNVLVAELDPRTGPLIDAAKEQLRRHFRDRGDQEIRTQVGQWKSEHVYPFKEEPRSSTDRATRELFDVVAVTARATVNAADTRGRRFSLSLLRQAIEQDPGSLRCVIQEVLDLPEDKLDELDELLGQTTLARVITVSKSITNRIDFLKALGELVLQPDLRGKVLERRQLHRILANETWVFGEEYALLADDESLRTALQRHIKLLERDDLNPQALAEQVADPSGRSQSIVDLMLARAVPLDAKRREHLVVELKRPSVTIGSAELQQVKDYAIAVARDPRFDKTDVEWDFVAVSTELGGTVIEDASQPQLPPGQVASYLDGRVRVWAKTWGQIIDDAEHRLKFVRRHLDYDPSAQDAFKYLRAKHAAYVPAPSAEPPNAPSESRDRITPEQTG
jgi:hypothetical protein